MKACGGKEVWRNWFLNTELERIASFTHRSPCHLLDWMDTRGSLEAFKERKFCYFCHKTKHDWSVMQPRTYLLNIHFHSSGVTWVFILCPKHIITMDMRNRNYELKKIIIIYWIPFIFLNNFKNFNIRKYTFCYSLLKLFWFNYLFHYFDINYYNYLLTSSLFS